MTPPKSKVFFGNGNFEEIGQEFKRYLIEFSGLQPHHKILDVGCGIGRMAIPLTDYISDAGSYYGIDIVKDGIKWCDEEISRRFNNFRFIHTNVFNAHYNSGGDVTASEYKFPFSDDYFDVVLLTSVFTHMRPADVENYLSEISRVLVKGGVCLITFYLINEESSAAIKNGSSHLDFKHEFDGILTTDKNMPEAAIAYPQDYVEKIFSANNLDVSDGIRLGSWCGRQEFLTWQDTIFARKI